MKNKIGSIGPIITLESKIAEAFSRKLTTALLLFLSGILLLLVVGFAQGHGDIIHNAAHDTRHSSGFPCH